MNDTKYFRLVLGRGPGKEREVLQTVYLDFVSVEEAAKKALAADDTLALVWIEQISLVTTVYGE